MSCSKCKDKMKKALQEVLKKKYLNS